MSDLPKAWTAVALPEVCDILDSRRVPVNATEREKRRGTVPYYGATGRVGWIDEPLFDEELVLLGEDGAPFLEAGKPKAYMIRGPAWVNNHAHVLRASPATSNRFLLHALNSADYRPLVNGTTRLKLTQAAMHSLLIPVPPRAEQERIVTAIDEQFSRLEAAEASLRAAIQRHRVLHAIAISLALAGDWPTKQLSDVTIEQVYGSSAKAIADQQGGVPIVRMGNICDGRIDLSSRVKYLAADHPDVEKYRLRQGDLLFNRTNSPELVGKSAVFDEAAGTACFASYLIRVRLDESCLPEWATLYLNGPQGRRWAASVRTQQVGQANINGTKLAAMSLPIPPVQEQQARLAELSLQLSILDALRTAIDRALIRSEHLRRAILQRAFAGRLVPQDASDEPASELLKRVEDDRRTTKPERGRRGRVSTVKV